ncbi:MAG: plasmid pRiA4b ORF-3 family protein [Nannocystis sp.]|nr:hypothetical protein [Nannocystis sp.]MBA3550429.1 plasmid pRiA4b ORF-3 family protein [Nannocystis sp.]
MTSPPCDVYYVTASAGLRAIIDFGDAWVHDIEVEQVYEGEAPGAAPTCVDGRRAGPPEDCGGIYGLQELLEDPTSGRDAEQADDEDYEEYDDEQPDYDPLRFSVEEVNAELARAFKIKIKKRSSRSGPTPG